MRCWFSDVASAPGSPTPCCAERNLQKPLDTEGRFRHNGTMIEFTTETDNLPAFRGKVEKFNNKAAALGLDVLVIPEVSEPRDVEVRDEVSGIVVERYQVVDIAIPDVEIRLPGGFTFVAVVEHLGAEGNLVNRSPFVADDIVVPAEYRTADPTCDHCGIVRKRNTTIVVIAEDGTFKRVGSTCAQSYLGIPASKLVTLYTLLRNVGENDYEGGGSERGTGAHTFLTVTAAVIATYGWKSRGVAREYGGEATADIAWTYLFGKRDHARLQYPELFEIDVFADEHVATAEAALEWLTDEIDPESNDYFWNLSVAVRNGFVNGRRSGIVASLIGVYQREMGNRAEREASETRPASTHFGDVKGRYNVEAELVFSKLSDGYAYGTTDIFAILRDAEGHTFWISTGTHTTMGEALDNLDAGDTIKFKGSVKAHHTSGKNEAVTKMIRCQPLD